MERVPKFARVGLIFVISFAFFFYLSFPYGVLKELISTEILNMSGFSVRMDELSPRFPFGVKANVLTLTPPGSTKSFEIAEASVAISILSLLIGNLSVNLDFETAPKGELDLDLSFSLIGLISGKNAFPHYIKLKASDFRLDDIAGFGLSTLAGGPATSPLLQPVLKGIGLSAKLNGTAKVDIDVANPQSSSGAVNISLKDAVLKLSDPSLGLPDQKFSSAKIVANLENGVLKIDQTSKFTAEELDFGVNGKLTLKKPLPASELDLQAPIKISGGLRDKFGFVLDAMAGGTPKNGEVAMQLKGTIANMQTSF